MPIRPEERARYPKHWPQVSEAIRARANGRCECRGECGTDHGAEDAADGSVRPSARCWARQGVPHPATGSRVVLTVAHLDHRPENCDPGNLLALCQRCHNRLDAPVRARGIQRRRRARRASGDLFEQGGTA